MPHPLSHHRHPRVQLKKASENLYMELIPTPLRSYPGHWQAIYQGGCSRFHILFDRHEICQFEREQPPSFREDDLNSDELSERLIDILSSSSLIDMRRMIQSLERSHRHRLYILYKRGLLHWKRLMRSQMN